MKIVYRLDGYLIHSFKSLSSQETNPKISAIGINKNQIGRGPGKSTEVEEYA
jgi:hypothetical protein